MWRWVTHTDGNNRFDKCSGCHFLTAADQLQAYDGRCRDCFDKDRSRPWRHVETGHGDRRFATPE